MCVCVCVCVVHMNFNVLFHVQLKRQFSDFIFPKLPGKRPFTLSDTQVDTRRRGIEDYMEKGVVAIAITSSENTFNLLQTCFSLQSVQLKSSTRVLSCKIFFN